MQRRLSISLLFVAVLSAPVAAHAGWVPGWTASLGNTLAIEGEPDKGGISFAAGPMWPVEDRFAFGVMFMADDMGTRIGRLRDPNDGTDLGATASGHGWTVGAGWRMDAEWGSLVTWMPFVSATWGYYRVIDDVRGDVRGALSSTGFSVAGGVRKPIGDRHAVGASVRYHRLLNDRVGRYVSLGVDWTWR